jgi:hypothetical protein
MEDWIAKTMSVIAESARNRKLCAEENSFNG